MRSLKKELWPHCVTLQDANIDNVEIWLGERIGGFKQQWNVVYYYDKTDFYFKSEVDAMLFALRWG